MRGNKTRRMGLILAAVPFVVALGFASSAAAPELPVDRPAVPTPAERQTPAGGNDLVPTTPPTVQPPGVVPSPLAYRIHSKYRAPSGDIVEKFTPAVLLVPTPVDVDGTLEGNQVPDVLAQLVIDAGRATFRVTAFPGGTTQLPLL
ncbi:MAG TPA: hypothetical protein VM841_05540, partial [Actinomycetota bacterium]|nr:hypothetical protein [Actinomycetota bacterium]